MTALLITMLALSAHAAEIVDSGFCGAEGDGSNLTWTLDSEGTLRIEGVGRMKNYDYRNCKSPWSVYSSAAKYVIISDGVTNIGDVAFMECKSVESVIISESVTSIGEHAFDSCLCLASATIPSSVKSIDKSAFDNCQSLVSVTIQEGVINIGDHAFFACPALESVSMPTSIKNIGKGAFDNCQSLTSFIIPYGVTKIYDHTFFGCIKLESVVIPSSVTSIGEYAFTFCAFESVNLPLSVTRIDEAAFYNCMNLKNVYYAGTEDDWGNIEIAKLGNSEILTANITFEWGKPLPVLSTDIRSYVFGSEIESYNVNGSTCIVAEDLMNYGFTVVWDGEARTLSITHPSDDFTQAEKKNFGAKSGSIGEKLAETVPTDIVTYVNGEEVQSYNIGGKTVIYIDALGVFGGVTWDGEKRTISVG